MLIKHNKQQSQAGKTFLPLAEVENFHVSSWKLTTYKYVIKEVQQTALTV